MGKTADNKLEVQLYKKPGKTTISRNFKLDESLKPRLKYLGTLKCVIFQPDDLRLITGSPTRRRDYLDDILSPLHWQYHQALTNFHKALKHRNELLDLIFLAKAKPDELHFWDSELIRSSQIICHFRNSFVSLANTFFASSSNPEIALLSIQYQPIPITANGLTASYPLDLRRGSTQLGPHREDFSFHSSLFNTSDTNLLHWASRGQERLAVLALKLAEINYIKITFNQSPILLLDDIFSELDPEHRQLVVDICSTHQSFITSAESGVESLLPSSNIINLS
jgi:DNA replication and repair protein RecF